MKIAQYEKSIKLSNVFINSHLNITAKCYIILRF